MSWLAFWRRKQQAVASPQAAAARTIGGRRFIAGVPYLLPKDIGETQRLDFQHYLLRYALKGNYAAPIRKASDILDVGCGTGRWAMEVAAEYPDANVIGVDVAPPPVEEGATTDTRPDNYAFVQGNVLERLPFADNSFDFVHQRLLILAIPANRWPGVTQELLRVTRPGGWVEMVEGGDNFEGSPVMDTITSWGQQLLRRRGIDSSVIAQTGPMLSASGATDVTTRTVRLPIGKHGGRVGAMVETNTITALTALRAPIISLGIANE
ncbi:MAG TPA: methyltransferase domain-containing protein, partial [Ktedonobacterales bacterium]|nr:methyltransferase domain-containing protein [Ktedonobacterales bacterium]